MSGKIHLHWGRVIDTYDSTYVYGPKTPRQHVELSPQASPSLDLESTLYEYGQLCFRILLIAYDYCVLKIANRDDSWMAEAARPENQLLKGGLAPMLSKAASELIDEHMAETDGDFYSGFTLSRTWDSHTGPLVEPEYVILLTQILDEDRSKFLIFMRSNYSLPLNSMFYIMFQVLHRTPPIPNNRAFIQAFSRVYNRYLVLAPGDPSRWGQHQFATAVTRKFPPAKQTLDAEDSKLLLRAYTDRMTILSESSPLHIRATSPLAVEYLQYILPLLVAGCEELVPLAIQATTGCMWRDLGYDTTVRPPRKIVEACVRLFEHYKTLFDFLAKRIQVTRGRIVNAAMKAMLDGPDGGLFSRLLSALSSIGEGLFKQDSLTLALMSAYKDITSVLHQDRSIAGLTRQMAASLLDEMNDPNFDPATLDEDFAAAGYGGVSDRE